MGLLGRRRPRGRFSVPRRALLAAASAVSEQSAEAEGALHQKWQSLAFGYYDKVGECWNPTQFYARSMAKLTFFMGERDPATNEIVPTKEARVIDLFKPLQQAATGEGGLAANYGRLKFLIGEGRLCQSRPPEKIDADSASKHPVWEYLSPTELEVREEGRRILRKTGGTRVGTEYRNISDQEGAGEPAPGEMRMWRFHRPHPQFSQQADSPVRSVLDLYEQLWWVTMTERAELQNRVANAGILLIPREIDFEVDDAEYAALGEDPDADPFMVRITGLMVAAISDPTSAAAASPGIVRAPAEMLSPDKFRHLKFFDSNASLFASAREEALVKRISIGLDLPIEEVMGLSMANHWTAWKVDDEKWAHVQPGAQGFCDDIFRAVMRPLMLANGVQDPDRFPVMYDNTELVTDPDKGKTAIVLHKDGVLKAKKTLEVNGFDPDEDLMDEEERASLSAFLHGGTDEEPEDAGTEESEPDTEEEEAEEPFVRSGLAQQAVLYGISLAAVNRAREVAGAKVRSLRRSCPECFDGMEDVPNRDLIAALGRDTIRDLPTDEQALINGLAETIRLSCIGSGYTLTADDTFVDVLARYTAETLYQQPCPPVPLELLAS